MATCSLISAVYTLCHGVINQAQALLSSTEKKIDDMAHQQLKKASQTVESTSLKNHSLKEILLEQDFLVDIHSSGTLERKIQNGKEVLYFIDHTLERSKNVHSFYTEAAFFNYLQGRFDVDTWEIKDQSLAKTVYLHCEPAGEGIEKCTSLAELYRLLSKETQGRWEIQRADTRTASPLYVLDQSSIFQLKFRIFNSKEALLEVCKLHNKQQALCSKLWKAFSLVAAVTSTMKVFHLWTDSMQGGGVSQPLGLTSLSMSYQAVGVTLKVATLAHLCSYLPSAFSQTTGMMSQSVTYLKAFGGSSDDGANAACPTSDGGSILAGYTNSFGVFYSDILVSKLASNGTLLWSQVFGGNSDDVADAAYPTSDGGTIVVGYTDMGNGYSDVLVSKLASNGTLIWTQVFGGGYEDRANAIYPTSDGGTIVAGHTYSFGAGGGDVLVSKLASNGTLLWTQVFGGSYYDDATAAYPTSDGGTIIAAYTYSFGAGGRDVLVSKLASNGTLLWTQVFGGSSDDTAYAAYPTSDGGTLVAGYTNSFGAGSDDFLVSKLASNGTLLWTQVFGGGSVDRATAAYPTSDGGTLVAGYTFSFGTASQDVLVNKLASNGTLLWTQVFGGAFYNEALAAYPTNDGGILVAGQTDSFGDGSYDVLVSKLDSNGNILNCPALQTVFPNQNTWSISSSLVSLTSRSWTPTVVSPSFNSSFVTFNQTSACPATPPLTTNAPFTTLALASASTTGATLQTTGSVVSIGSTTSSSSPSSTSAGSSSLPIIIGSVAGGVALVALGALGIGLGLRRKRRKDAQDISLETHPPSATALDQPFQHSLPESMRTVIGQKYALIQKINRSEAQDLYNQTGFEVFFLFKEEDETEIKVGRGNYGNVEIARNTETGHYVAVKKVEGAERVQASKQEAELSSKLKGKPHLISYLDSVEFKRPPTLFQFMPLASFGDGNFFQWKLLSVEDLLLKDKLLLYVAKGLLTGMQHMHEANIYHLDLKPANFVMDSKGSPYIIDFGCATESPSGTLRNMEGDICFFAPERIECGRTQTPYRGDKADSWSLGLTLLNLFLDQNPFQPGTSRSERINSWDVAHFHQVLSQVSALQNPAKDSFLAMVKGLLDVNPQTRLNALKALQMPVFKRKDLKLGNESEQELQKLFKTVKNLPSPKVAQPVPIAKYQDPNYGHLP